METTPTAHICVNKSRRKIHDSKVYLNSSDEFQIELYNPTSNTVGIKIEMNGNLISYKHLILRPGERYFLDRYIDEPKKFRYDTYEIDDTPEGKKAVESNGKVKVSFYNEDTTPNWYVNSGTTWNTYNNYPYINSPYLYFPTINNGGTLCGGTLVGSSSTYSANTKSFSTSAGTLCGGTLVGSSSTYSANTKSFSTSAGSDSVQMETGRVGKGGDSGQSFQTIEMKFNSWAVKEITYQIMPISTYTGSDLSLYCQNCNKKAAPKDNFCSICGYKL